MRHFSVMLAAVALLATSNVASAVTLSAGSDFSVGGGVWSRTTNSPPTTGIEFLGTTVVEEVAGDFTGLFSIGDTVVFETPLIFDDPLGLLFTISPNVTFTITDSKITPVEIDTVAGSVLVFNAAGFFTATGFEDTAGEFTFTGQQNGSSFSFSAGGSAFAPIPVPASILLLAAGLVGLGLMRARQSAL